MNRLNRPTAERLSLYHLFLRDHLPAEQGEVSSHAIARFIEVDDTLVRKDLAAIGIRGRPRTGYNAAGIIARIREVLGFNQPRKAILVGAGHLGGAIVRYQSFREFGLDIIAMFDNDPRRIGVMAAGLTVQPMDHLAAVVAEQGARLAVLTVPAEAAQAVTGQLVAVGITAIWCFSSTHVQAPAHVVIRHERISAGLAELLYRVQQSAADQSS